MSAEFAKRATGRRRARMVGIVEDLAPARGRGEVRGRGSTGRGEAGMSGLGVPPVSALIALAVRLRGDGAASARGVEARAGRARRHVRAPRDARAPRLFARSDDVAGRRRGEPGARRERRRDRRRAHLEPLPRIDARALGVRTRGPKDPRVTREARSSTTTRVVERCPVAPALDASPPPGESAGVRTSSSPRAARDDSIRVWRSAAGLDLWCAARPPSSRRSAVA